MDTNVIIAIVAVVVIAALLAIGGWWFGKSRKSAVDKSTEAAKAKADARLATEKSAAQSAAASAENAEKTKETAESAATEAVESATSSATPESPVATEPTPVGSAVTESATPAVETPEAAGTRMQRLKARLSKSGNPFGKALFNILAKDQLSEADWEDVEDTLLLADVGAEASEQLVEELRNDARIAGQSDPAEVRAGDILRAVEGSTAPVACDGIDNSCTRSDLCSTVKFWRGLDEVIENYVDGVTLADLAAVPEINFDIKL